MECKYSYDTERSKVECVLIETLWNVNLIMFVLNNCPTNGINRNIMECKSSSLRSTAAMLSVLIETLWNVNMV